MTELTDNIREGHIEFFSGERKLDTSLVDFGEYNQFFGKYIADQSGEHLIIGGQGLKRLLSTQQNLDDFTSMLVQILYQFGDDDISIHVDVDIDKANQKYVVNDEEFLNPAYKIEISLWHPELTRFERDWNVFLDLAIGGMVGYPGYEHPQSKDGFNSRMTEIAHNFIIGTKEQLSRYFDYTHYRESEVTYLQETVSAFM